MEPSSRGNSAGPFPLQRLVQRHRGRRARNRCADLYRVVRFLSKPRFSLSAAVAAEVVFPGVAAALLRLLRRIKFSCEVWRRFVCPFLGLASIWLEFPRLHFGRGTMVNLGRLFLLSPRWGGVSGRRSSSRWRRMLLVALGRGDVDVLPTF